MTQGTLLVLISGLVSVFSVLAMPADPAQLDDWLAQTEQTIADITPGAEKTIEWFAEAGRKTPLAVVYLHGFSATRQESAPFSSQLAKALGANVFHARLTGHGRPSDALGDAQLEDWFADATQAYQIGTLLGERVLIVSVSTGSTLSTWLASQPFADKLAAMIMMSPNFDLPDQSVYRIDWPLGIGVKLAEWTRGKEHAWKPHNEAQARYWTHRYPVRALRPMVQLLKVVRGIDKSAIRVPTMMIYSPTDQVVAVPAIVEAFAQFGADPKELWPYTESEAPSQHVLAGDILAPASTARVLAKVLVFLGSAGIDPP